MDILVPADLAERASAVIGAPFLAKGDAPDGWDCRGCVRWCLSAFLGLETPDYRDLYEAAQAYGVRAGADRSRLIADGLAGQWRPVEPQAGAVAWLEWTGVAGHVGLMLTPHLVLHADVGGTRAFDLRAPSAPYRLRGAFTPAFVTRIIQPEGR